MEVLYYALIQLFILHKCVEMPKACQTVLGAGDECMRGPEGVMHRGRMLRKVCF